MCHVASPVINRPVCWTPNIEVEGHVLDVKRRRDAKDPGVSFLRLMRPLNAFAKPKTRDASFAAGEWHFISIQLNCLLTL